MQAVASRVDGRKRLDEGTLVCDCACGISRRDGTAEATSGRVGFDEGCGRISPATGAPRLDVCCRNARAVTPRLAAGPRVRVATRTYRIRMGAASRATMGDTARTRRSCCRAVIRELEASGRSPGTGAIGLTVLHRVRPKPREALVQTLRRAEGVGKGALQGLPGI